jgi:predicted  nucleic acid-binding Zn-ribbon protein
VKAGESKKEPGAPLIHVHVCVHCGGVFRREVFEGRPLTSGIFPCPKCGFEGPLNVEIRGAEEPKARTADSPPEPSSG